jgi:hypothetical protein
VDNNKKACPTHVKIDAKKEPQGDSALRLLFYIEKN